MSFVIEGEIYERESFVSGRFSKEVIRVKSIEICFLVLEFCNSMCLLLFRNNNF